MSEIVERAALAAWLAYCGVEDGSQPDFDDDGDWQERRDGAERDWKEWPTGCTHIGADGFRECARAAIGAMRDPSDYMETQGGIVAQDDYAARTTWQAMIDAALSQGGEG